MRQEYDGILKIDDELLCTDSSVVLSWINQGPRVGGLFVANRVKEISAVGGVWSWVPTDENPADLLTRGTTVSQLSASKLWWNGPHWLTRSESVWPKHQDNVETEITVAMMTIADSQQLQYLEDLVNPPKNEQLP